MKENVIVPVNSKTIAIKRILSTKVGGLPNQAHVTTTKNTMTYTGMARHGTVRTVSSRQ